MYDSYSASELTDRTGLPAWRAPSHPVLMAAVGVAVAAAAWHGLLWRVDHPRQELSTGQLAAAVSEAGAEDSLVPAVVAAETMKPKAVAPPKPASTPGPAPASSSMPVAAPDADSEPALSPFRRAHPWAAVPGQPYYYPSRCPATLRFPDLVFFRTEGQARAGGYVPAPDSGCG